MQLKKDAERAGLCRHSSCAADYYPPCFAPRRYVFDGYCGTSPKSRKNIRIITELAWQHHFAKNMFIRPASKAETAGFEPDFTIINACKVVNADYKELGLNSEVAVVFNVEEKKAVITGTW